MEGGYQIIVLVCGVPRAHYRLIVKNTKRHFFFWLVWVLKFQENLEENKRVNLLSSSSTPNNAGMGFA